MPSNRSKTPARVFHMLETVIGWLFRCSHKRITLPITPVHKPGTPAGPSYVVCLDCGGKFVYDWKEMRMGEPLGAEPGQGDGSRLGRLWRRAEQAGPEREP